MDSEQAERMCVEAVEIISRESTDEENRHAADLLRQVSDAGFSQGMFGLAELMMAGKGVPKDEDGAIGLYEKAGSAGNVPALFRLGNIYWTEGEHNRPARSFECFSKCCELGFPPAYNCLGDCYFYGIGTVQDPAKAVTWYKQAVEAGDGAAMFKLGCMYEGEMGVPKDEAQSVRMFMQAAVGGVPEAQFRIATLAYEGKIDGGKTAASKWYESCSDAIPVAKFNLATMYYSGDGVEKDLKKAFGLYHELAHAGDADAMYQVGKMLLAGEGVDANGEDGFRHIAMAAQAGNEEAKLLIDNFRRRQNTQLIHIDGTE